MTWRLIISWSTNLMVHHSKQRSFALKKSKIPPKVLDLSMVALHIMTPKECPIFVFVCQRNKFPFCLISFFAFLKALPFKNFQKCHGTYPRHSKSFQDLLTQLVEVGHTSHSEQSGYISIQKFWVKMFFFCPPPSWKYLFFWKNTLLLNYHLEWHHLTSQICQTSVLEISEVHRLTLIFIEELDLKKDFQKREETTPSAFVVKDFCQQTWWIRW